MTTKQAAPVWRKEADGHYRLVQKPPVPKCLDPEIWTPQRLAELIEKWRMQHAFVPPDHLSPLTDFQVGDWVRVGLVQGNRNTNHEMYQLSGQWFEVEEVVENISLSPGMLLQLKGVNWNWYWYHLNGHSPVQPKPKQQPPLLPDI